jgi:anti-anti-sigma factor
MTDTLLRSCALPTGAISRPVVLISAYGEIDGANAHTFTEHSLADLAHSSGLILDMTQLEFFGAAGFSALHRISVGCARAGKNWAAVPGDAVSLVLRICDPDGLLPTDDTVGAALARVQGSFSYADHPESLVVQRARADRLIPVPRVRPTRPR